MPMGRPRENRKDLPPGLYWTAKRGFYFYRKRDGQSRYKGFGHIKREDAIRAWLRETGEALEPAADGTVAELIDSYLQESLPERIKAGDVKEVTAKEYRRQAPHLRTLFGAKRYARTPAEAMRPDVLRHFDVKQYLRGFRGQPGAVAANRMVGLLSAIFSAAQGQYTTYNPCLGVKRNPEEPRRRAVTQDDRDAIAKHASPVYRLMLRLTEATGMRLTDVRNLLISKCGDDAIDLRSSKTDVGQVWEITPAVRAILAEARTLPGRSRSMFVFPTPKGTAYTEGGVHHMRKAALKLAGLTDLHHRDLRKAAVNEAKAAGMNATDFAGHVEEKTTRKHYLNAPVRVKPIR